MSTFEFSEEALDQIGPVSRQVLHWDTKVKGLGICVGSTGVPSFVVTSRVNGKQTRVVLGKRKHWSVDEARVRAQQLRGTMRSGVYPKPGKRVTEFPDGWIAPELPWVVREKPNGYLYAVAIVPELSINRIKLGWTTGINQRLRSYATICPTAIVLGVWEALDIEEDWLLAKARSAGACLIDTEVFDIENPFLFINNLSYWLAETRSTNAQLLQMYLEKTSSR